MLQQAQPGLRILELGRQKRVLSEVGHRALDFAAVRAIGEHYGVDAVFAGDLEVSEAKPSLNMGQAFTSFNARADVSGQLAARLFETRSGATLWSRSSTATANVAHLGVPNGGMPSFGASDPSKVYGGLVRQLVSHLRHDFYPRWVRQ